MLIQKRKNIKSFKNMLAFGVLSLAELSGSSEVNRNDVRLSLSTYDSWLSGEFLSKILYRVTVENERSVRMEDKKLCYIGADFVNLINPGRSMTDNQVPGFKKEGYTHMMPVNVNGNHWVLMCVTYSEKQKLIEIYDSLHPNAENWSGVEYRYEIAKIQWWFDDGRVIRTRSEPAWEVVYRASVQQENNYDCGVWVFKNFSRVLEQRLLGDSGEEEEEEIVARGRSPFEIRTGFRRMRYMHLMPLHEFVFGAGQLPLQQLDLLDQVNLLKDKAYLKTSESIAKVKVERERLYKEFSGVAGGVLDTRLNMSFISEEEDLLLHEMFNWKVLSEFHRDFLLYSKDPGSARYKEAEAFIKNYHKHLKAFDLVKGVIEKAEAILLKKVVSTLEDFSDVEGAGVPKAPSVTFRESVLSVARRQVEEERLTSRSKSPQKGQRKGGVTIQVPQGRDASQPLRNVLPPSSPIRVFKKKWPENDLDIDKKLQALEEWVGYVTGGEEEEEGVKRAKKSEEVVVASGGKLGEKRGAGGDEDDEGIGDYNLENSSLVREKPEKGGLWVNKPGDNQVFNLRIVDGDARLNANKDVYITSIAQIKHARSFFDKKKKHRPPYIRSAMEACVTNDAFRVLVLSDHEIYDNEEGLPPKFKIGKDGQPEPVRRITPQIKKIEMKNPSWDATLISHNEAMVFAARFNSYYVVLALIKLYLDRRALSKPNRPLLDEPRFLYTDFDLFWNECKALKVACAHGAYETVLILLNPLAQKIAVVSANRTKRYLSSPLDYKPIRNGAMLEGLTPEDAEICRGLLSKQRDKGFREDLRLACLKRLDRLRPREEEKELVVKAPRELRRSSRNKQ